MRPIAANEQDFLREVFREFLKATCKFPEPGNNYAALQEEIGEISKAMNHMMEGKGTETYQDFRKEIVQAAAMCMRLYIFGDKRYPDTLPREVIDYEAESDKPVE